MAEEELEMHNLSKGRSKNEVDRVNMWLAKFL